LRVGLHDVALDRGSEEAIAHVLAGFGGRELHPDLAAGINALHGLGIRLVTLSNGSASIAEGLFERAGIRDAIELV
jgi:2-haloacid dehalogenase